jgi:hypothetical protein
MVTERQGKSIMKEIVARYRRDVQKNPHILKDGLLSEQDITTKFVLPMLSALNWDVCKIDEKGYPEVHEKAFKE